MKTLKKLTCLFLALTLVLALPVQALADTWDIADGDISIDASGAQTVTQGQNAKADSAPVITGTSTENTVTVTGGGTANVTIQDVNISPSGQESAITVTSGTTAEITVQGENNVTGGSRHAGVEVSKGATLTITEGSTGSLNATGGSGGAGIGGVASENGGNITINGGTVNATGGAWGTGIGGGIGGNGGDITINGGTVTADGGEGSYASIGGSRSGNITINGGTVKAGTNVLNGIGIGGSHVDSIVINGGDITAMGHNGYTGIGSHLEDGTLEINGGNVTAVGGREAAAGIGTGLDITITGGTVTAQGGNGTENRGSGAGIGSRGANFDVNGYSSGSITITGGIVNATAGTNDPAFSGAPAQDIGGGGGKTTGTVPVTITGGTVNGVCYDSKPAAPAGGAEEKVHKATGSIWDQIHWELSNAEPGSEFIVDAGSHTWIPRTLIEKARSMDITLIIQWDGGEDITVTPTDTIDLTLWQIDLKELGK